MWVDKYGFEIFMGDQEERKEGDRWIPDEDDKVTMSPKESMKEQPCAKTIAEHWEKENKPKNVGLF